MEEFILKFFDKANIVIGTIITGMTSLFGVQWILFASYLILNIVDFITGCIKARVNKVESSSIGLKGVIKKVGYWLIILVAFIISNMISDIGKFLEISIEYITLFGWFTLVCLAINELRSILENLVEIGVEVPEFLVRGLEVINSKLNEKAKITAPKKENKN